MPDGRIVPRPSPFFTFFSFPLTPSGGAGFAARRQNRADFARNALLKLADFTIVKSGGTKDFEMER
jgi:hypothetical protein